jgi:uncharacterized protein
MAKTFCIAILTVFSGKQDAQFPGTRFCRFCRLDELIDNFINLDDDDITSACKVWAGHKDKCLSMLSGWFTGRSLYRVEFRNRPFKRETIEKLRLAVSRKYSIPYDQSGYFVVAGDISNYAYRSEDEKIRILE